MELNRKEFERKLANTEMWKIINERYDARPTHICIRIFPFEIPCSK